MSSVWRAHGRMSTLTRAQKVAQAASRIFGTHIGNGLQSGRKELRKNLAGPKIMSWYHRPIGKDLDPLFVDPEVERRKLKIERLARRGKVTPKKGEGKRAKKK